jgi:hypothetical protein
MRGRRLASAETFKFILLTTCKFKILRSGLLKQQSTASATRLPEHEANHLPLSVQDLEFVSLTSTLVGRKIMYLTGCPTCTYVNSYSS